MEKKTKIQIMSIYGNVLFEHESVNNTIRETTEKAVISGADLSGAALRGADFSDADLSYADLRGAYLRGADLRSTYLSDADLRGAYLSSADFSGADLSSADFRGAYLRGADFSGAYLSGAYLRGSDLSDAIFDEPIYLSDLYSIKQLPKDTVLTYWKYIINGKSPIQDNKIEYKVGKTYAVTDFDIDEYKECSKGLNVATIFWCLKETIGNNNAELIECQFKVSDIVAIPYFTDGKFRVKRLKVLRKISRDEAIKELQTLTGLK